MVDNSGTVFGVQTELKSLLKKAQCTHRDIASVLGIRPSTLNNYLNGYAPLGILVKQRIEKLAHDRIRYLKKQRIEEKQDRNKKAREIIERPSRSRDDVERILRRFVNGDNSLTNGGDK